MELTPAKFLALFLCLSVAGWLFFTFAARLVSWILSRMIGAQVQFRFGGLNSVKDITLTFKKGNLESVIIGEVRLRTSRVSGGSQNNELPRGSFLQLLFYDVEVILRNSTKQSSKRGHSRKNHICSRGKWMIFAKIAKYLTVSVADLLVQTPDWTVEIKELDMGIDGVEPGLSFLDITLLLTSINIHERENQISENILSFGQRLLAVGGLGNAADGPSTVCSIEHFSISSTVGHERDQGVLMKRVGVKFGEIILDLNDELLYKKAASKNIRGVQVPDSGLHAKANAEGSLEKRQDYLLSYAPEKATLNMSKLFIKCRHEKEGYLLGNEIEGMVLRWAKIQNADDVNGPCRIDIEVDVGEIHLLRDIDRSLVEIMKAAIIASCEIPRQANLLQAEIDVKFGGAQFNLLTNKFEKWTDIMNSIKSKRETLDHDRSVERHARSSKWRINWSCTVSAPEMTLSLHDLNGIVLYNICAQTSHVFLNYALNQGAGIHIELGELFMNIVQEQLKFPKNVFGMDTSSGCLFQVPRVTLDWGVTELDCGQNENEKRNIALVIEASGICIHLTLNRVKSLLTSSMSIGFYFYQLLAKRQRHSSSKGNLSKTVKRRRVPVIKLLIEGISIQFCTDMHIVDVEVADPKKVNFDIQGGEVLFERNVDGKPRKAFIRVATFNGIEGSHLLCKSSINIAHLQIYIDYSRKTTRVDFTRLSAKYQELSLGLKPITEVIFTAVQNGQIVYQMIKAVKGDPDCLICLTDLRARWEPDIHLFIYNTIMQLKSFHQKQKDKHNMNSNGKASGKDSNGSVVSEKRPKSNLTVAVDLEQVTFSAALADGVESSLSVATMFSEDCTVGILFERLKVTLNGAAIMRSEHLQIARVPSFLQNKSENSVTQECAKCGTEIFNCWDYLIHGSGLQIILPYRLECRAIDDAIEDTWRGLKLVMAANNVATSSSSSQNSTLKPKSSKVSSIGAIKFLLESVIAEIEEEPFQGWFDEHHQLISKQRIEMNVRERLLDEFISAGCKMTVSQCSKLDLSLLCECGLENVIDGKELDFSDPIICGQLKTMLQQQHFETYKKMCESLQRYESSGSVRSPFQSGFKPSINRGSLMSIQASKLEVALMDIQGGRQGMIEQIRKLDCISSEIKVPYSRVLGKQVKITTASLIVRLRNYTLPIFAAEGGKCTGQIIFARQATCFPNQIFQELYIGRWRKLSMLRSESGTTPPFKMFSELPIEFGKAEVAYGVGFEPSLTDISYAFSIALKRANLSVHDFGASNINDHFYQINTRANNLGSQPVKKERNLPWWDDMRYYVHGKNSIMSKQFKWVFLATTNPYEAKDMMKIEARLMHIQQKDGTLSFFAENFKLSITSLENIPVYRGGRQVSEENQGRIRSQYFQLDVTMDWDCESGKPLFHYLHAFPEEQMTRERVYDPFRSTSLVLKWDFHLGDATSIENCISLFSDLGHNTFRFKRTHSHRSSINRCSKDYTFRLFDVPTMYIAGHDLAWIFRWWSTLYSPPHKLRTFSKWPRFGVPRVARSGNLSLDKVLTDFMLRVDSSPAQIKHISLLADDPAKGLTFKMRRFKYELWYSRGWQPFDTKRDILELVYQDLDLDKLKAELWREEYALKGSESASCRSSVSTQDATPCAKSTENAFFFRSEYFSLRKQGPKVNLSRLSSWQEEARKPSHRNVAEFFQDNESDLARSDTSDDDEFIVSSDNCLHISLHSLKLLWDISKRNVVWAWVEDIHRAFEPPKPSPSRQYAQRRIIEEQNKLAEVESVSEEESCSESVILQNKRTASPSATQQSFSPSPIRKSNNADGSRGNIEGGTEEGTMHFMVNVIKPQFNLQSEEARGRFLLAAASGKVIAQSFRSFRSIKNITPEMIAQTTKLDAENLDGKMREFLCHRRQLAVILEQVQAHVAPTDVDPGAGLQWLPKIPRDTEKMKRTGALLEPVFTPCTMYFQYNRWKNESADIKVKALKELSFNSTNITATMTSRQFQVMVDIISNLLLARLPKPRRNLYLDGDEEVDVEELTDEVVPEGVSEVEHARVRLEQSERDLKLLLADLKALNLSVSVITTDEADRENKDGNLWMIKCGNKKLEVKLGEDWVEKRNTIKSAKKSLRSVMQRAAHQQFKEKEKNKSIPSVMCISWTIEKIEWKMIHDGQIFAETEINSMNLNVDRNFHEVGNAQISAKHFVVKNCLPHAKSETILSAWNPPNEWGRRAMLRVDAKQGAPKDGHSPLEHFQVEIYPLKIHLTEKMSNMMWGYFFPVEDRDLQRVQAWKASTSVTTAAVSKGKKTSVMTELPSSASKHGHTSVVSESQTVDSHYGEMVAERDFSMKKRVVEIGTHQRSSSFDRIKEDDMPENLTIDSQKSLMLAPNNSQCASIEEGENMQKIAQITGRNTENVSGKSKDISWVSKSHKPSLSHDDKKLSKSSSQEEKKAQRLRHTKLEFHNIKICQVELLVTYEGSMLSLTERRFLIDTFTRTEFTGTWRRLFSRVRNHIIWSVLKSVAGMQGKKFKGAEYPGDETSTDSEDDSSARSSEQPFDFLNFKKSTERAGEGFVSSIRGLFNSQRRKAKIEGSKSNHVDVGDEAEYGWSEGESDSARFSRQRSFKRLLRRSTKKILSSTRHRGSMIFKDIPHTSPPVPSEEVSSDASSHYQDFND